MKTFLNRLFILAVAIPILLWTTVYELVVGVPKLLFRAWKSEIQSMKDQW